MTSTQITKSEKELPKILKLEITNKDTLTEALSYLSNAKKDLKALTQDMDTLINPLKESISAIKAKYEPRQTALKSFIELITKRTSEYQTSLQNTITKAQNKIANKVSSGYLKPETAVSKFESLPTIDKRIENTTFITHKMCELEDISKVPLEYHLADMVAVRKLMNAGIQVKGIKYWTEQRPRNNKL